MTRYSMLLSTTGISSLSSSNAAVEDVVAMGTGAGVLDGTDNDVCSRLLT